MSQIIKTANYSSSNIIEQTKLTADIAAAVTTLPVENSGGFANNDYVYIGNYGAESGEMKQLSATPPSGTSLTITATTLAHNRYDQAVKLFGNQIRLYRAANVDGTQPTDANFSLLSTTNIDFDQTDTSIEDASGSSDYWYKYTYYNETSSAETSLATSGAMRGGGYGNYCSIEQIRQAAGLTNNRWISDTRIDEKRQAAQDEVNGALVGLYTVPFTGPIPATIQDITARIAAGLLLTSQMSNYVNTNDRGKAILDAARADLDALQDKKKSIVVNGASIAVSNVGGFSMYPDADTAGELPEDDGARFTSDMRY